MIKEAIIRLSKKEDLSYTEAEEVMNEIMEGKASPIQISSYLTGRDDQRDYRFRGRHAGALH